MGIFLFLAFFAVLQLKDFYTPIIKALRRDLDLLQIDLSSEEEKKGNLSKCNDNEGARQFSLTGPHVIFLALQ